MWRGLRVVCGPRGWGSSGHMFGLPRATRRPRPGTLGLDRADSPKRPGGWRRVRGTGLSGCSRFIPTGRLTRRAGPRTCLVRAGARALAAASRRRSWRSPEFRIVVSGLGRVVGLITQRPAAAQANRSRIGPFRSPSEPPDSDETPQQRKVAVGTLAAGVVASTRYVILTPRRPSGCTLRSWLQPYSDCE